ncbi:hypothetical protein EJ04DRAFT_569855 [Polyplosphaeria fusca]|uniref:Uncharacterized protein n=1 Tax=Polyplosphaeria fusca TaxID=682080 RepID=A0A9P4QIP6_9PLEO|nr:hypothetical protein EJ04DRAFT_569855 [Polyplosphaeria fusca]
MTADSVIDSDLMKGKKRVMYQSRRKASSGLPDTGQLASNAIGCPFPAPELATAGTADRKLDVDDPSAGVDSKCHWKHILIPGELKSNPSADKGLEQYARGALAAQDSPLRARLYSVSIVHGAVGIQPAGSDLTE